MKEVLSGTGAEMGSSVETKDDEFGYRWMIVKDPDIEDLAVGVNAVNDALAVGGYNDRVLAAVFAFETLTTAPLSDLQLQARQLVPVRPRGRRQAAQHRARAADQGGDRAELPFEPELERWFPLWGIPI
jgi:hypothetical protein